jgi:hypothetical protein
MRIVIRLFEYMEIALMLWIAIPLMLFGLLLFFCLGMAAQAENTIRERLTHWKKKPC